jgi:GTP-binding protein HflX
VENKLFATLDSTVRTLKTAGRPKILITDTVGLIDKLPHSLVASFKSTLDEIRYANLIIKVVDITHQCFDKHISTTQNVLQELGVSDVPSFWVFNKIDLIQEEGILDNLKSRHPDSIFVSGKNSSGINLFKEKIKSSIVPISHYHPA